MKKFFVGLLLLTTVLFMNCTRVEPGYDGIKVKMMGQNKGVQPIPVSTGRYWTGAYWEIFDYPTFTNIYPFTADSREGSETNEAIRLQSIEGLVCDVDIALSCHAKPGMSPIIFQTYKHEMIDIIKKYCQQDLNTFFIEFSSQYKIDDVYSTRKMEMLSYVNKRMKEKYDTTGIIIDDVVYKSEIRLPQAVAEGITAKVNATVIAIQKQNEIVQEQAEAQKKIAQAEGQAQSLLKVAQSQAQANKLLTESITQTLINYELAKRWNGVSPIYSGNGAVLPPIFGSTKQ
jgi:regulator of protease activity HflC (stomatin/prohibitin superfamily)